MRHMTNLENKEFKKQHLAEVQAGSGIYVYENNTKGTLLLPKPTRTGKKEIEPVNPRVKGSGRFQGDDYYMNLVKSNMLKLVETIQPAQLKDKEVLGGDEPAYRSIAKVQKGKGVFLYENNTKSTLILPKPTVGGLKMIEPINPKVKGSGRFQGDDYYISLVKTNQLRLIEVIVSPAQEEQRIMNENKLIVDQPDTFTNQGKVEQVVAPTPLGVVKEGTDDDANDVLLNENPMDDVEILGD